MTPEFKPEEPTANLLFPPELEQLLASIPLFPEMVPFNPLDVPQPEQPEVGGRQSGTETGLSFPQTLPPEPSFPSFPSTVEPSGPGGYSIPPGSGFRESAGPFPTFPDSALPIPSPGVSAHGGFSGGSDVTALLQRLVEGVERLNQSHSSPTPTPVQSHPSRQAHQSWESGQTRRRVLPMKPQLVIDDGSE